MRSFTLSSIPIMFDRTPLYALLNKCVFILLLKWSIFVQASYFRPQTQKERSWIASLSYNKNNTCPAWCKLIVKFRHYSDYLSFICGWYFINSPAFSIIAINAISVVCHRPVNGRLKLLWSWLENVNRDIARWKADMNVRNPWMLMP